MSMEIECNYQNLFNPQLTSQFKCEILSQVCGQQQEIFNFFQPFLCFFHSSTILFLPLQLIYIFILFLFIIETIEKYMAPGVVHISKVLNLSDALAGVTLLAFANGAGDVITALVASDSKEGISYNIGALYGAGLFVITFVIAKTIQNSTQEIIVESEILWRDIGFYLIAVIITIYLGISGEITVWDSILLLLIYLIYVLVVVFQSKQKQVIEEHQQENLIELNQENEKDQKLFKILGKKIYSSYMNWKIRHESFNEEKDNNLSIILEYINIPFHYIRKYTIPPSDPDNYSHQDFLNWPILGIIFIFFVFQLVPNMWWFLAIPITLGLLYFFRGLQYPQKNQVPQYFTYITILGIFCSVLWTKLCVGLLVDSLTQIGMMLNLSSTYIGLTILAIGNALPDGLTTIAIAKKGQALMGITGGVAGQLFGLLIGFGSSMLKKTLKEGTIEFDLFSKQKIKENFLDLLVILVCGISLLFIFIYGYKNKLKFDNFMADVLLKIYYCFIGFSTLVALYIKFT